MNTFKKLNTLLKNSKLIEFNDNSKIIIMSDCHRGTGTGADNFMKNQNIFYTALKYYYNNNYTYIELGDGDELWENKKLSPIVNYYADTFTLLENFYYKNRLYMLFGNHDIMKKTKYFKKIVKKKSIKLFDKLNIEEGLILKYNKTDNKILLIHGHQGDLLNDRYWKMARFLVRYIWRPLELIGINNPTSPATNYQKKISVDKKLINWSTKNKQMLIAGHTHKPIFPQLDEHLYFNDGCCTNPAYITGIEITNGYLSLIKWSVQSKDDRSLFINKDTLVGPVQLVKFFK